MPAPDMQVVTHFLSVRLAHQVVKWSATREPTILALAGTLIFAVLTPLATYAESEFVPVAAGGATGEVTGTVMVVNTEKRMLSIKKE